MASRVYISGPMTGIPEFNAPAFKKAGDEWRAKGWDVVSPVDMDSALGDTYEKERKLGVWQSANKRDYLRRDLLLLMNYEVTHITAIYMLKGWENSEGAKLEHAVARAFGLIIEYEEPPVELSSRQNAREFISKAGVKYDAEKLPWHLLPYDALEEVCKVLQHGALKYDSRNWERGMEWHRVYRAAINHLQHWWRREGTDADSKLRALAHAACSILFLLTYEIRNIGEDDRP